MTVTFDGHYWVLKYRLEQFTNYLELLYAEIVNEEQEFTTRVNNQAKDLPEEAREGFYEYISDDYDEVNRVIPRLFLSSFVVTLYSFIERELYDICRSLNFVKRGNFRTEYAAESKKILERHDCSIDDDLWKGIQKLGYVRNKFVHNDGRIHLERKIPKNGKEFVEVEFDEKKFYLLIEKDNYDYLQNYKIIEVSPLTYIVPSYEYCLYLIDFTDDLFARLYRKFNLS